MLVCSNRVACSLVCLPKEGLFARLFGSFASFLGRRCASNLGCIFFVIVPQIPKMRVILMLSAEVCVRITLTWAATDGSNAQNRPLPIRRPKNVLNIGRRNGMDSALLVDRSAGGAGS